MSRKREGESHDVDEEPKPKRARRNGQGFNPSYEDARAVELFREYLRVRSVHPTPDYEGCVHFLRRAAEKYELPMEVIEVVPGHPIVIMTWPGSDPSLPSVLLNSHTDVVPVVAELWDMDPFEAYKDDQGRIYGRGAQDMKCLGIQYLESVARLRASGYIPLRNVYLSFVPDEEIGGALGMKPFLETERFKALNIAVAMDEGLANPTEKFTVFYGERAPFWVNVTATGNAGHGSRFIADTVIEKLHKFLHKALQFREEQRHSLEDDPCGKKLGDVITLNVTILKMGTQQNVVPSEGMAGLDIRLPPAYPITHVTQLLDEWIAGEPGLSYSFNVVPQTTNEVSSIKADNSPWWRAISESFHEQHIEYETEIFPAGTDSRFLRQMGIPAYGFSPMNNTPILLHDHNEYLDESVFLKGIHIYCDVLKRITSVP